MNENQVKCLAPFRGFYQGYNGQISVCCKTPIVMYGDSFEESMQDPKVRKLRQDFLNGFIPKECEFCTERVRSDQTEMMMMNNQDQLSVDYHKPVLMDLLWSNKCNFGCMGCKPFISTTIYEKYLEPVHIASPFGEKFELGRWKSDHDQDMRIDYVLKNSNTIKYIHLNGGEPFLQDGFYDLLEKLIEKKATHIEILTHTNGSVKKYKGKSIIDLMKQFKSAKIYMSHDGIGEKGEYVRYGLKQKIWESNFREFKKSGIGVYVRMSYNIFNCLDLDNMADWYNDVLGVKPYMGLWDYPPCFSAKYINKNPKLYEKAMRLLEDNSKRYEQVNFVLNYMKEPVSEEELKDMSWRFSESISSFDKIRNTNFLKTFPELESLYY
jgi:organic radical activating enzyme